jgi:hypothetical protein
VAPILFYLEAAGPKIAIVDMDKKNDKSGSDKYKLEQIKELLTFALSLEDQEIIKSTVEAVIEILDEEIGKYQ